MAADWVWLSAAVVILLILIWLLRIGWRAQKANWGNAIINALDGLNRIFCVRYHGLVFDQIPLPERGGAILAANHVSGLDPLLLGCASPRPLRYMIATEQYNRPWFKWLYRGMGCIPVDRDGAPEKAFYAARQALNDGELIMVFPQGRIVPLGETVKLKRGAILLADLAQAPIIPLRLSGIGGAGRVLSAIVIRSRRARLETGPVIRVNGSKDQAALARLQEFITASPGPPAEP